MSRMLMNKIKSNLKHFCLAHFDDVMSAAPVSNHSNSQGSADSTNTADV